MQAVNAPKTVTRQPDKRIIWIKIDCGPWIDEIDSAPESEMFQTEKAECSKANLAEWSTKIERIDPKA